MDGDIQAAGIEGEGTDPQFLHPIRFEGACSHATERRKGRHQMLQGIAVEQWMAPIPQLIHRTDELLHQTIALNALIPAGVGRGCISSGLPGARDLT